MSLRGVINWLPYPVRYGIKYAYSLLPLRVRYDKQYWNLKAFLSQVQWLDRESIEAWQLARLREIVRHSFENVPGYRALYHDAGVSPGDISSLAEIRLLPFVTKELLRDNLKDFTARNIPLGQCRYVTTGGSTGIPVGFYQTNVNRFMEKAFMHSGWERVGWRLGDKSAVLRGAFIGSEERLWEYDPLHRELFLSNYYLTNHTYSAYKRKIETFHPKHLKAYPSAVTILADLVLEKGDVGCIDFDIILLGSENIYDWQKKKLKEAFPKSRLFSWYGQAEQVVLAPWCEKTATYHVWPFYGLAEILDQKNHEVGVGDLGEIVGTSFWNYATPFIRYRSMDLAKKGGWSCKECGRQFLILETIEGRLQEMIITKSNRHISMTAINMHSDVFNNVSQFQFYQDTPGKVIFRVVPKETYTTQDTTKIRIELERKLGNDMELEIMLVKIITRTPRGKMRFLEQRLNLRYGE